MARLTNTFLFFLFTFFELFCTLQMGRLKSALLLQYKQYPEVSTTGIINDEIFREPANSST